MLYLTAPFKTLNQICMNRLLIALLASFFFTGCIDILEELYLNADGSGTYTLTTDMSAFMSPEMKELMNAANEEENGQEEEAPLEIDSVIMLKEVNPEAFAALERPEVFKTARMHLIMSDSREKMIISYILDFDNIEDINYFRQHVSAFSEEEMDMFAGGLLQTDDLRFFSMDGKKTLIRHDTDTVQEELSEEELSMMEMMFSDGTYKTIYHFPGKVKSTTIPNAKIEGNTLVAEAPLLDMMKGEAQLAGAIKFKRH